MLGYGYRPGTTGIYFERSLQKNHKVTYVGNQWGGRRGFPPDVDLSKVLYQLKEKPDIFFFIEGPCYFPHGMEKLPIPTACYLIDVYIDIDVRLKESVFFDYIFVAQRDCVQKFKELGNNNVHWLPVACDSEIHRKFGLEKIYDIGFVGQIRKDCPKRIARLEKLAQKYRLNDYRKHYQPEEIARIYSQSKIVFNSSYRGDLNMRVFESLSSGAMLLTDRIENGLEGLFKDREHLVLYDDDNLMNLADYYLRNDGEREEIAAAGHKLALARHTYDHRVEKILEVILNGNKEKKALMRNRGIIKCSQTYAQIYSHWGLCLPTFKEALRIWYYPPAYLNIFTIIWRRLKMYLHFVRGINKNIKR